MNFRLRNLFIVLFLLFSLTLTYGCSSKPSEETMKNIIQVFDVCHGRLATCGNYEKFQITNDFHKKVNDENWYCIEVNSTYNYTFDGSPFINNKDQERYCFTKRGKEWYGVKGWPN